MRSFTVSCVVLSAIVLLAGQANAELHLLEGFYSKGQLNDICDANGGKFTDYGVGNVYSCQKKCGTGTCTVQCDSDTEKCNGMTPDRKVPVRRDALGVLRYAPDLASPRDPKRPLPVQPRHDPAGSGGVAVAPGGTVAGPADFSASRNGTCCLYKGRTARLVRNAGGCVKSGGRVAPLHYCGKEDGPAIRDLRARPR